MTREEAEQVIADGQPWSEPGRGSKLSESRYLGGLSSWSPIVRERMAGQLKNRKGNPIPQLVKMLKSDSLDAQRGALQAMSRQWGKLAPAVPELRRALSDDDMWVRVLAAKALVVAGPPGRVALPQLLKMLTQNDPKVDPRQMEQRYLNQIVFDPKTGMLKKSLHDVNQKAFYAAVKAGLQNEDGNSRKSIASVYKNLVLRRDQTAAAGD